MTNDVVPYDFRLGPGLFGVSGSGQRELAAPDADCQLAQRDVFHEVIPGHRPNIGEPPVQESCLRWAGHDRSPHSATPAASSSTRTGSSIARSAARIGRTTP